MTIYLALQSIALALAFYALYLRFDAARMTWTDKEAEYKRQVEHLQRVIAGRDASIAELEKTVEEQAELIKQLPPPKWVADWRRS